MHDLVPSAAVSRYSSMLLGFRMCLTKPVNGTDWSHGYIRVSLGDGVPGLLEWMFESHYPLLAHLLPVDRFMIDGPNAWNDSLSYHGAGSIEWFDIIVQGSLRL